MVVLSFFYLNGIAFSQVSDMQVSNDSSRLNLELYARNQFQWITGQFDKKLNKNQKSIDSLEAVISRISNHLFDVETKIDQSRQMADIEKSRQAKKNKSGKKKQKESIRKDTLPLALQRDSLLQDSLLQRLVMETSLQEKLENEADSAYTEFFNLTIQRGQIMDSIRRMLKNKKGAFSFILPPIGNAPPTKYLAFLCPKDKIKKIKLHFNQSAGKPFGNMFGVLEFLNRGKKVAEMITNAGMFTPNGEPKGLFVEEGKTSYKLDIRASNPEEKGVNFYLQPNGVFWIDKEGNARAQKTSDFHARNKPDGKGNYANVNLATQSGPMLVINGRINSHFTPLSTNRKIRSGVGVLPNGSVLFLCTTGPENFYNFSTVYRDVFKCKNALFLDGEISRMYLKGVNENPTDLESGFGPILSVSK
jgi:uncharacterized protein YigE (DUF2233 family)